ncbi:DNA damage-binding protein 1a [Basidiobolus ranarum]|uniref:DNA damage-binding protein 1a n=1 Tax=Basidiobolus ranarum TaxID=34480 RepID=A0ABR2W096_9FUNG
MSYNYVVTAHKPTSVQAAVKGNFTSSTDTNLIVSKGTRIEIYLLAPEGLRPYLEFNILGRIASMGLYRPPNRTTDLLFISTERYKFLVLSFDQTKNTVRTEANGDLEDFRGVPCECGQIGLVDHDCRLIGLHLYEGALKIITIENEETLKVRASNFPTSDVANGVHSRIGDLREPFNIRLEELQVISMAFLYGTVHPTIAILHQDTKEKRHIRTYEVLMNEKEIIEGPWYQTNVPVGSNLMFAIPRPFGGVIVVGEANILYVNGEHTVSLEINQTVMNTYGQIDADGSRFLLGDYLGNLYILVLFHNDGIITELKLERLGETAVGTCIVYLDNSYAFIGSHFGDSQLIKLNSLPNANGDFIEVIQNFANLAPIADFCIVDVDSRERNNMISCSGAFKDGSLRVIRNGVGVKEQAKLEMSGIKGTWSLRNSYDTEFEDILVISFIGETRILVLEGEEMQELEDYGGFQLDEMTICTANVLGDFIVQITESSMRLINYSAKRLVSEWTPPSGSKINVASINPTQIVAALGGGTLIYFEIHNQEIKEIDRTQLEYEIACLDINPINPASPHSSNFCVVGLWTEISVNVLRLPDLQIVSKQNLGGEIIPRSTLMAEFEGINYLFIALGDGHMFSFLLDTHTGEITNRKRLTLGTQPIVLTPFKSNGASHIFCSSDRPIIIYSRNQKLGFSNVNIKEISYMCPFNSSSFPNSLVLAADSDLTIGTINEIQKLHIRTIPLGEMPRRIVHQASTKSFGVLTVKLVIDSTSGEQEENSFLRIFNHQSFEAIASFQMDKGEKALSIGSLTFENDPCMYYAVGTAYMIEKESEPQSGRILIFRLAPDSRQLLLMLSQRVNGAVYNINQFNGRLLTGINNQVNLYHWSNSPESEPELIQICSHRVHILALYIATRGDFLIVGDVLRSITLLTYNAMDGLFEVAANDYSTNWLSSAEILDGDTFIGAETAGNIFIVKQHYDMGDDQKEILHTVGRFHLGDVVNCFRHGSLAVDPLESDEQVPSLMYCTVDGAIGYILTISQERYDFLTKVQENLIHVIRGIGGLDYVEWRSYYKQRKSQRPFGFLDGDLIESYLDLKREHMQEVVTGKKGGSPLNTTVEELSKIVEEMLRLH